MKLSNILLLLAIIALTYFSTSLYACSSIGKDKQTTETELAFVDLAIKGKVIGMTESIYYDTASFALAGLRFDLENLLT